VTVSHHYDQEGIDLSDPLLTIPQAARLLAVRDSWVEEAVRTGRLPCIRIGRHIRFTRSDLEAWVGEHRVPGRTCRIGPASH